MKAPTLSGISLDDVSVVLGRTTAVDHVSIDLARGQIIGFIGPSGAGKTSLIRVIVGRQRLSGGTITIDGRPAGSPALRRELRYMTQEPSVYGDLSVRQNLAYFARMVGVTGSQLAGEMTRLLSLVDLEAQADQLVASLSGGQRQRVSLAIALIGTPTILVLDEPTVGLDPVLRLQLWQLFRQIAREGTTIIVSSHVMDEAERCDDLVLLRDGRVLAHDTPKKLTATTHSKSVEEAFVTLVGMR